MISEGNLEEGFNACQQTLEIRKKGIALCLVLFFLAAGGGLQSLSAATKSIIIGVNTVLPNTDSGNGGLILGQQASLGQQATLQSLSFYIVAVNSSTLRLGLYDATGSGGLPGHKLAETALINPVVGWNTAPAVSQVSLAAGTYWLVYEPSSSSLSFKANFNVGPVALGNAAYGPLPATFPSPTASTGYWSFYGTLTPSSPPDPSKFGMWSGTVSLPIVPVHSALLRDGRIL